MENEEESIKRRSQRDYTMAFKLLVVSQVEKGEYTYKQAQQHYGIQGRSTVLTWLIKHGTLDWNNSNPHYMAKGKETPAQELKRLRKEVEDWRLINELKEEALDIIDREIAPGTKKKYLARLSEVSKKRKR
jgi:transposase-like protein